MVFDNKTVITSAEWGWFPDFAPKVLSTTVLVKPGGTSGLEVRVCGGKEEFSESLSEADGITESLDLLLLFKSLFSSLESSISEVMSKSLLLLSRPNFCFSWNDLCCSFLINSKEARRVDTKCQKCFQLTENNYLGN